MSEPIHDKNLVEYLRTAIRYLASGFVTIFVLQILEFEFPLDFPKEDMIWYMMISASIFGFVIYSVHAAIGDDIFYQFTIWQIKKWYADKLPDSFKSITTTRELMFKLTEYRLKREGATNPKFAAMQARLEQELTFLVFLYGSSYPMIFLPLASFILKGINALPLLILSMGIVLVIIGTAMDLKVTERELWFVKNFQKKHMDDELKDFIRENMQVADQAKVEELLVKLKAAIKLGEDCDDNLYK